MHPDAAFAMSGEACRAIVGRHGFAHIFVHGAGGAAVIHAPVLMTGDDRLTFHVARRNRAFALLADARAIASVAAVDGYVSPDWYASPDQVPTWNYVAVEAEGPVAPLDRDALVAQVDALSAAHEARLAPKPAWSRDKMDQRRFEAMVDAIAGFEIRVEAWRGTAKLSQNKRAADIAGVIAALATIYRPLADAIAGTRDAADQTAVATPIA